MLVFGSTNDPSIGNMEDSKEERLIHQLFLCLLNSHTVRLAPATPPPKSELSWFHSCHVPNLSPPSYFERILTYIRPSIESCIHAIAYMKRIAHSIPIDGLTIHRVLLAT